MWKNVEECRRMQKTVVVVGRRMWKKVEEVRRMWKNVDVIYVEKHFLIKVTFKHTFVMFIMVEITNVTSVRRNSKVILPF